MVLGGPDLPVAEPSFRDRVRPGDPVFVADGTVYLEAEEVTSVGVRPLGPSGTYTVNYRVTSADGHVVSGSWPFRLTVAGTGTPGPSASASSPSESSSP